MFFKFSSTLYEIGLGITNSFPQNSQVTSARILIVNIEVVYDMQTVPQQVVLLTH